MPDSGVPTQFVGEQLKSSMRGTSSGDSSEHDGMYTVNWLL